MTYETLTLARLSEVKKAIFITIFHSIPTCSYLSLIARKVYHSYA